MNTLTKDILHAVCLGIIAGGGYIAAHATEINATNGVFIAGIAGAVVLVAKTLDSKLGIVDGFVGFFGKRKDG